MITLFSFFFYLLTITSSQTVNGSTDSPLRNYSIGLYVSKLWASGSGDTIYFQICNDDVQICAEWYSITGGLDNEGEWYYFTYLTDNIGSLTSINVLTEGDDQLCLGKVDMDGNKYENTVTDCIEISETSTDYCDILNVIFEDVDNDGASTWTTSSKATVACPALTNAYISPPQPTNNGTRTYRIKITTSNLGFSGTTDDLYFRLCVDAVATTCTNFYTIRGGMNDEGYTYVFNWNTDDIGDVGFVDFVTFGSNRWCLSDIRLYQTASISTYYVFDAGVTPVCISADEAENSDNSICETMSITLSSDISLDGTSDTQQSEPCNFDSQLINNSSLQLTDSYIIKYKVSAIFTSGSDQPIFFILQTVDGYYSPIYEINDGMDEEGDWYEFEIDISDIEQFRTVSDIFTIDTWTYEDDGFCISDISIAIDDDDDESKDILNADASAGSACVDVSVTDEGHCTGIKTFMQINSFGSPYYDTTDAADNGWICRWDNPIYGEPIIISKASIDENIFDWISNGYNWVYLSVGLIGLVIVCILMCCFLQRYKQKHEVENMEETDRPWHGGNSAFYG